MIILRLSLALLVSLGLMTRALAAPSEDECAWPDEPAALPLPHVAEALLGKHHLDVLAIGSASVFGPEASLKPGSLTNQTADGGTIGSLPPPQEIRSPASDNGFTMRMANQLGAAVPGAKVTVVVRGGRGLSAQAQLGLLTDELKKGKFQLVLWQTGTVEAVRNLPPAEFAEALATGANLVAQSDADLILIDPQFSRFLQTNSNLEPYEEAFQQVSALPGVTLFHRFDLMRSWVSAGRFDLEHTTKANRFETVTRLHACLGQQLARLVLQGAEQHP